MKKYKFLIISLIPILLLGSSINTIGQISTRLTHQTEGKIIQKNLSNTEIFEQNNHEFTIHHPANAVKKTKTKDLNDFSLEGWIYTKCNDIEKRTPIARGLLLPIDVDNNENTGPNGNDIQTRFYLYPAIEFDEKLGWPGIVLTLTSTIKVDRLSDEIKEDSFEIYLEIILPDFSSSSSTHRIRVGYYSAEQEEIPSSLECSLTFKPYFFYNKKPEFTLSIKPNNDNTANEEITLLGDYAKLINENSEVHQMFAINYNPMITTTVSISPGTEEGLLGYTFSRNTNTPSKVTFSYDVEKQGAKQREISLQIDELPTSMSFSLGLTPFSKQGGSLEYKSTEEYDVTLSIWGRTLGLCKEVQITQIPWEIDAQWQPTLYKGYVNVQVKASESTEVIIADDLDQPEAKFVFNNLSTKTNATWNFGQTNGTFEVKTTDEGLLAKIYWALQRDWMVDIDSQLKSEYLNMSWNMQEPGSLKIDTDNRWMASFSFELQYSTTFGISIGAAFIKAEDYHAQWKTIMPPTEFSTSGEIQFMGDIDLGVMLQGNWYWIF